MTRSTTVERMVTVTCRVCSRRHRHAPALGRLIFKDPGWERAVKVAATGRQVIQPWGGGERWVFEPRWWLGGRKTRRGHFVRAGKYQDPSKPAEIEPCRRCGNCPKVTHRALSDLAEEALAAGSDHVYV